MKVLIFLDYFTPAFKAGGPARIFEAVARGVVQPEEVSIVTQDRDLGDKKAFEGVPINSWTRYEKADVFYASSGLRNLKAIKEVVDASYPDVIHLNSLFSRTWTLKLLVLGRLGLFRDRRVLLSPHGELAAAALNHKKWLKRIYIDVLKTFDLFRDITFVAHSEKEMQEITREIGKRTKVILVNPPFPRVTEHSPLPKKKGELKLVFFARISAMKNIGYLNRIFPKIKGRILFDVYGPIEEDYKDLWFNIFARMRKELVSGTVTYKGPIPSTESAQMLTGYDLFVQPSLTENFGYSILESLASGTPVLISDQTPWNQIKTARCGNAVSLEAVDTWVEKLQSFVDMDDKEWREWSARATAWVTEQGKKSAREMFNAYAGGSHSATGSGDAPKNPKAKDAKIASGQ